MFFKHLVVAVSLLLSATPAVPAHEPPAPIESRVKEPGTLYLNLASEPITLDPGLASDSSSGNMIRALFDGLTRKESTEKPVPSVAEKIDISADKLAYTFTLRKTKWSNGEPLTAHDFEYAWKRVLAKETKSEYAFLLYPIKNAEKANKGEVPMDQVGVKALNNDTLQVELEHPTPYFLELTSFYTYYPVPKKLVASNPKWAKDPKAIVGNGPFLIKNWERRSKLVLEKNNQYWDEKNVSVKRVDFSMFQDSEMEWSMFDNGDLDWAGSPFGSLPTEAVYVLNGMDNFTNSAVDGVYWYKFNTERPPFQNEKIRKAFAYAVNREEISSYYGSPATSVLPPRMAVQQGGYFKDYDVDKAKQLLQEGMKELGLKQLPPITLTYNSGSGHLFVAEIVADQWKEALGVDVKLQELPWVKHQENQSKGNFQIARMGWLADYNDPKTFLEIFKEKNGANNDTRWENKKYAELLTQSDYESDPEKRRKLLGQAEQILMDEMPVIPIYHYLQGHLKSDRVSGILVDGFGMGDLKWAKINQ
ncbi:MAG: peptide ABC transporter substrate-binding protein [Clostridia bacterium]